MLIDPFESRAEVALLHMPIETNPAVIEHIFQSLNPEWKASAIKQVPGEQMRADRWKLLVACSDKRLIPLGFVLPEMGPERQDVNVKVFVRGKKADFQGRDNLPNRQNSISSNPQHQFSNPSHPPTQAALPPPQSPPPPPPTPPPSTPPPSTPLPSTVTESSSHTDDTAGGATGDTPTGRTDPAVNAHQRPSPSPNELKQPQKKLREISQLERHSCLFCPQTGHEMACGPHAGQAVGGAGP